MKILSAAQIKEADLHTIQNESIDSVTLMERAARICTEKIIEQFKEQKSFCILCGPGNNGGDGLVIARLLWHYQKDVSIYYCNLNNKYSNEFLINKNRIEKETDLIPIELNENNLHVLLNDDNILIDCIFGNGINKSIDGWLSQLINTLNNCSNTKIAIDLPSGLFADNTLNINGTECILKCDYTYTFQSPKLSLLLPEGIYYSGEVIVLDIGLDKNYIQNAPCDLFYITNDIAKNLLKKRPLTGHKGTFGHAYLICGSAGKAGAAALSAKAALRSGCGLVTVETAENNYASILSFVPEAIIQTGDKLSYPSAIKFTEKTSAIGIGPGIGNSKETNALLKLLLNKWTGPLVLDADALNIISDDKTLLSFIPAGSILTPHPGEFDRLFNLKNPTGYERIKTQIEISKKHNLFIVLKGFRTSVSTPKGRIYFNSTGNNGMATAGSGDVLTGVITSLLAQNYYPLEAAILGIYIHGLAGDLALSEQSYQSVIASDIIENLGKSFKSLQQ